MTLDIAAQLLTTALMLLQAVSANPSLPQSTRDGAQAVAQQAITEATRIMGKPAIGANTPSCKIVSDKFNYAAGEVVVLDYISTNARSLEFIPVASQQAALPVPTGELLGLTGQYRKAVEVKGYPFLVMKATGANGQAATCSAMVNVH